MRRIEEINGAYAYNLVTDLIDYCGDVKRNSQHRDQPATFSQNFSPNNIRRLILSGSGARIYFHVPVKGVYIRDKAFSDAMQVNIVKCMYQPDYKPMIWALADRVCSSIEEVIICTQNKGGIDLSRELDFEGLLSNRRGKSSDVKSDISARYRRLAYFTIVNCDIGTLVSNQDVRNCNKPLSLISETNFVKSNSVSITKFKDDWFNYYGTTSTYSFDNAGSPLNNHFKEVKDKAAELKKSIEVAKIKEQRLKGISEEFDKEYKKYQGMYSCARKLAVILAQEGTNYISRGISPLQVGSFTLPQRLKDEFSKISDKDECKKFIANMKISATNIYSSLVSWFLENTLKLSSSYKLTTKLFLDTMDRSVFIPDKYSNILDVEFKGANMVDSTSNICCYSCLLFITDAGKHDMSKYYMKDTWMGYFKGGAE